MKYDPFQGRKQQKITMVLKKEIVNKTTYWDLACMNNKFRDINNSWQWNQTCATCGPCIWPCTKTYLQFISNLLNISKPQKNPGDYISQLLGTGNYEFDLSPHTHTLYHIVFLPCRTYADFEGGLIFSKASPTVKTQSFSTESVLCQWSLSKAGIQPSAWNLLSFRWLREKDNSEATPVLLRKMIFSVPRDFILLQEGKMN